MNELDQQEKTLLDLFRALPLATKAAMLEVTKKRVVDKDSVATEENYQVTLRLTGSYVTEVVADDVEEAIRVARADLLVDLSAGEIDRHTRVDVVECLSDSE